MKRLFSVILISAALMTASATASAQFFNSMSLGVGAGVDGVSLQLGFPVGSFLQLRLGGSYTPPIGYAFSVDGVEFDNGTSGTLDLKAKLAYMGGNAMLDLFPGRDTKFHFTFGVFGGNGKLATLTGTSQALADEDKGSAGIRIGNTLVTTDENGYCTADLRASTFLPYFGIGAGRAVREDSPVSFVFDFGACYTKDGLGGYTYGTNMRTGQREYIRVTSADIDNEDSGVLDILGKIPVLPVMKFSLFFRLF